jgi:hypothetical protein
LGGIFARIKMWDKNEIINGLLFYASHFVQSVHPFSITSIEAWELLSIPPRTDLIN